MKKLLLSIGLLAGIITSTVKAGTLAFSLTTPGGIGASTTYTNTFQLTTNRINVYQVQISSTASGMATFWANGNTNAPFLGINYTNASYWYRAYSNATYASNMVGMNGSTNWYTNNVIVYYNVTNAVGTNQLQPIGALAYSANVFLPYNVSWLCPDGLSVSLTTNANIVLFFNNGD